LNNNRIDVVADQLDDAQGIEEAFREEALEAQKNNKESELLDVDEECEDCGVEIKVVSRKRLEEHRLLCPDCTKFYSAKFQGRKMPNDGW
jgi:hypothetical protein